MTTRDRIFNALEAALTIVLGALMLAGSVLATAVVLGLYGAFYGAIGAGAYLAFRWLVGLFV